MITKERIREVQKRWADGIIKIGQLYKEKGDYVSFAKEFLKELYNYDEGPVLFKPTKAKEKQFRLTFDEALSYFIGGMIGEDKGFALEPWENIEFEVTDDIIVENIAISQGNYYFTSGKTGEKIKVEFTFVYKLKDNKLKIIAHHSSIPFSESR
ncbi:MAG: hypothetical protein ACPLSJ_02640 [Thermosulfidibacteraceae bacterium]|jgi:hypothetical protein